MPSRELLGYIDRCQVLVGRVARGEVDPTVDSLRALLPVPSLGVRAEQIVADHVLESIIARCNQHHPTPEQAENSRLCRSILDIVTSRYQDPSLRVEQVAQALQISRWQLGRVLVRATGHHFRWHVGCARVNEAARLMVSSALSMKEIATAAGFKSAAELTRHFVAHRGMTPTSFRKLYACSRD